VQVFKLLRSDGCDEGRAEWDSHKATARAQDRRTQFRAIPGGGSRVLALILARAAASPDRHMEARMTTPARSRSAARSHV
jgi:hypothetical protein